MRCEKDPTGHCWLWWLKKWPGAKDAGGKKARGWKRQGAGFSPGASRKEHSLPTPGFQPREIHLSRTLRSKIGLVLRQFLVIYYSSNRKWTLASMFSSNWHKLQKNWFCHSQRHGKLSGNRGLEHRQACAWKQVDGSEVAGGWTVLSLGLPLSVACEDRIEDAVLSPWFFWKVAIYSSEANLPSLLAALGHMGFPGEGSDPSYSARLGIEPASWHCRDTTPLIASQREVFCTLLRVSWFLLFPVTLPLKSSFNMQPCFVGKFHKFQTSFADGMLVSWFWGLAKQFHYSVCQFPWYKCFHQGWGQGTNLTSLKAEVGRDVHSLNWAGFRAPQRMSKPSKVQPGVLGFQRA